MTARTSEASTVVCMPNLTPLEELDPDVAAELAEAGPVDEFTKARLRVMLTEAFGPMPAIDLHLDLLDVRGAWYAERAFTSWSREHPDSFFGLVQWVVSEQMPGPSPEPDVYSWLAAGRPGDQRMADLWDSVFTLCAKADPDFHSRLPESGPAVDAAAARLEARLDVWPDDLLEAFELAYVKLPLVLRRKRFAMPPIGR